MTIPRHSQQRKIARPSIAATLINEDTEEKKHQIVGDVEADVRQGRIAVKTGKPGGQGGGSPPCSTFRLRM